MATPMRFVGISSQGGGVHKTMFVKKDVTKTSREMGVPTYKLFGGQLWIFSEAHAGNRID